MKNILHISIYAFAACFLTSCPATPGISLYNNTHNQFILVQNGKDAVKLDYKHEVQLEKKSIQIVSNGKKFEFRLDPNFLTHIDDSTQKNVLFIKEIQNLAHPRKFILLFTRGRLSVGYYKFGIAKEATYQPDGFPLDPNSGNHSQ